MNKSVLNLPNIITMIRFPAGLGMLWLLMQYTAPRADGTYPMWIAIAIAIVSVITFLSDFLDGKIARSMGIVTNFGKIMDPIADSLFFTLLLLGLAVSPRFEVTIWFTVIMFYREAGVQVMRRYAAFKGVVLMAGWAGKLKMLVQCLAMAGFGLALLASDTGVYRFSEGFLRCFAWWGSLLSALVGILSLIMYLRQLPQMMEEQSDSTTDEN